MSQNSTNQQNPHPLTELELRRFNHSTKITNDKIYLRVRGAVIGTSGNFITLVGLPKTAKSTFLSFILGSFINAGEPCNHFSALPYIEAKKYRIALFDTEQLPYDFSRKMRIVERIAGDCDIYDSLDAFLLSDCTPRQILRYISEYLKATPEAAIIVIDGLLDIIENMNDEAKSKALIRYIKKLAKLYDVLFVTVLHLGKKDMLSLGHLGSAADRAAQSVIVIEKTKNETYTASPKMLRSAGSFEPIEIQFDSDGIPRLIN